MLVQQQKMEEEPRIKINVQYIFNERSPVSEEEDFFLQISPSEHPSLHEHLPTVDLEEGRQTARSPPARSKSNRMAQTRVTAETQLLSLTRLIKEKEASIKKLEHVDSAKITTKLFKQNSAVCSKILKKQASIIPCACKQPPPKQEREPSKEAGGRASRSNLSRTDVHERLYNMSKSQILKEIYMPSEPRPAKAHRRSVSSLNNKYLKNYTPFEKRLEEYLNREQFAASQSMLRSEQDFRPQLIPNKYADRVQSRYRQGQLREAKAGDFADFMNSSVSSSRLSATSRSAALAEQVEEHFLQKMRLVFVRSPQEEVEVEEGTVGLLTEVEFSVLQPFIMYIEENRIKGAQFEELLRSFYEALTPVERMQLRNHELKNKCKYLQLKNEIKQRKSPKKQLSKVIEKPVSKAAGKTISKKQFKPNASYHLAIQNFI